jgi:hypothetical protein
MRGSQGCWHKGVPASSQALVQQIACLPAGHIWVCEYHDVPAVRCCCCTETSHGGRGACTPCGTSQDEDLQGGREGAVWLTVAEPKSEKLP